MNIECKIVRQQGGRKGRRKRRKKERKRKEKEACKQKRMFKASLAPRENASRELEKLITSVAVSTGVVAPIPDLMN